MPDNTAIGRQTRFLGALADSAIVSDPLSGNDFRNRRPARSPRLIRQQHGRSDRSADPARADRHGRCVPDPLNDSAKIERVSGRLLAMRAGERSARRLAPP
jgi:hypothetical protein